MNMNNTSANDNTLQAYELSINEYVANTAPEASGNVKIWIDSVLELLPATPKIIEIGSAFGRDAEYIESKGFKVTRTDAAKGFVSLLQEKGYPAYQFNPLKEEFSSTYDLIFANAVFLHFTPNELQEVFSKIYKSLNKEGILAFSVKHGHGEEWTSAKVGKPRYFCYWQSDQMKHLLESNGFRLIKILENEKFLLFTARK